jgi:hypothetical protein
MKTCLHQLSVREVQQLVHLIAAVEEAAERDLQARTTERQSGKQKWQRTAEDEEASATNPTATHTEASRAFDAWHQHQDIPGGAIPSVPSGSIQSQRQEQR